MARKHSGPWLRKSDLCWYTTVRGKLVRIGGPGDDPATVQRRYDLLHSDTVLTVATLIKRFIDATRAQVADTTLAWYAGFLREFAKAEGGTPVIELTASTLHNWVHTRYAAASTRHAAGRAVQRLMNWAVSERIIDRSPVSQFRKAAAERREFAPTGPQYAICLRSAPPELRDVIKFLHHSGARPQELRALCSRHRAGEKMVLPMRDSKGRKVRRVIYLSNMAGHIIARLAAKNPTGPLFRNATGKPWTKSALVSAFRRLRAKVDMPELVAYSFRHAWITRLLEKGVDVATVAMLAGNSPRMVLTVYAHVTGDETRLRKLLE